MPHDFIQYTQTHVFTLPRCFHNHAVRLFQSVKKGGEFEGLWVMACYKRRGEGYCPYWGEFLNIFGSIDSIHQ